MRAELEQKRDVIFTSNRARAAGPYLFICCCDTLFNYTRVSRQFIPGMCSKYPVAGSTRSMKRNFPTYYFQS